MNVLSTIDQLIHCQATQLATIVSFHVTFVYGMNKEQQRLPLWTDLMDIARTMSSAWCVIGDFNAVLYKHDRIGGDEAPKVPWAKVIWTGTVIPRHAFISWTFLLQRLPTKHRISRFSPLLDTSCSFCNVAEETDQHIIYECAYATEIRERINAWWRLPDTPDVKSLLPKLIKTRGTQVRMQIS
ncbi:hypothetical protein Cgig2_015351 [Carnegiea gigantea]|uniref:Reverse transcriptase zinc-binding domain-containing protein n=1 Tax=Carnegiea gigantea TaxID=171969 RepID=A0A9Q1GFR9_9CARY|nr:hypothetical protein Cgig2_015351 [Carnegiea gigantea]